MNVDYIIVGQGICGSFLSRDLLKAGKTVLVIDDSIPLSASKIASGVINPITGRRLVRTWEIETLMPFAVEAYQSWGVTMGTSLIQQCNILDFHPTPQMVVAFAERLASEKEFLRQPSMIDYWKTYFNFDFGIGEIDPCWLIDINALLNKWRLELKHNNHLLEEVFHWEECIITQDHIAYKNIIAQKIIFCEGELGFSNPYFKLLPYSGNKGEALIVRIPDLPRTNIFKQGMNIVPWQNDLFWIGSSYEWDFIDKHPSPEFLQKVKKQLTHWLKLPFEIMDHVASVRPANMERRPFIGLHPMVSSVGIFNGMGTKGCSLVPYFSLAFTNYLVNGLPLNPQVDVRRFSKVLSR